MDTVLVVDDEKNYLVVLSAFLTEEGYETITADNAEHALKIIESTDLDLVLTDMKMSPVDGIELLGRIKERLPDLPVVMMTAYGTVEKAVEAMQLGAFNFILKPFQNETLRQLISKAIHTYKVLKENQRLIHELENLYRFDNIIGKSKPMQVVFSMIQKVAASCVQYDSKSRPHQGYGTDYRRKRNRQGISRQSDSFQQFSTEQALCGR